MYGSTTDASRSCGTHRMGSDLRANREMGKGKQIAYGTPKHLILALDTNLLVEEVRAGIEAYEADNAWTSTTAECPEMPEFVSNWNDEFVRLSTEVAFAYGERAQLLERFMVTRDTDLDCCFGCGPGYMATLRLDMALDDLNEFMDMADETHGWISRNGR